MVFISFWPVLLMQIYVEETKITSGKTWKFFLCASMEIGVELNAGTSIFNP